MPICAVCGMASDSLTRCKNCGDRFCEECGEITEKICLFCLDDGAEDLTDDGDSTSER